MGIEEDVGLAITNLKKGIELWLLFPYGVVVVIFVT